MNKYLSLALMICIAISSFAQNFSTDGNGIRKVVTGQSKGKEILYISELDGAIACYTVDGKELWRNATVNPAVLFKIVAADVNNDGNDEVIAASGDGSIYCYTSKGKLLWQFTPQEKVRFSEVAVLKLDDKVRVFAGGNDQNLYELDESGKQLSLTKVQGLIRTIEVGNFVKVGEPSLFVITYSHDKFRWQFFGFIDPETKQVIKSVNSKDKKVKAFSNQMITDISVADITKNGKDEVLLFGTKELAEFNAIDGDFNIVASFKGSKKHKQRYAHTIGTSLQPIRDEIAMQFGGVLYVLNLKGELINQSGEKYNGIVYNDLTLVPSAKALIGGGQVGGDNSLYFYPLKNGWFNKSQNFQGRIAEVNDNLNTLYSQALQFKMPSYQNKSDKEWVMISSEPEDKKLMRLNGADMKFVKQISMQENFDRTELVNAIGEVALKKDKRKQYNLSQKEIVALAKDMEAKGQPFTAWTGHGNDPYITSLETMLKVLEVAPNTCYGFIYAEMHDVNDPRVQYFIDNYVPALAKAMRKNGKAKLYFRYKNMFWAATSHMEPWKQMFFSGEYADILVPASEDTSSRTQDINLAGRIGMWAGGYIDDFAMRLVDDNPTSWRPLTPGGQRSASPYLRQGVMMASYGARYGINFKSGFTHESGHDVLYALMMSGVLPLCDKEDVVSIGSWHLIKNVDADLLHDIDNHHKVDNYTKEDGNAVFSVTQMRWAGVDVPAYDYSALLGVKYRWLNYIPELPNGMIPIAPVESAQYLQENNIPYSVSDCKQGIVGDKKVEAKEFGSTMVEIAKEGKSAMPVLVEGAAWSAIRIDENHIRVILMDQGYVDPQKREATIKIQGNTAKAAVDILSNEIIKISNDEIKVVVPAGSLRFIDLSY